MSVVFLFVLLPLATLLHQLHVICPSTDVYAYVVVCVCVRARTEWWEGLRV